MDKSKLLKTQLALDLTSLPASNEDNDRNKEQAFRLRSTEEDEVVLEEYLSIEKLVQKDIDT